MKPNERGGYTLKPTPQLPDGANFLSSNWLIVSFGMCELARASQFAAVAERRLESGGPAGLFMWSKQCGHCGRGRRG